MRLFGWPPGGPRHGELVASGGSGITYEVFRPPWWRPWLWLWWIFRRDTRAAWGYIDAGGTRVRVIAQGPRAAPRRRALP